MSDPSRRVALPITCTKYEATAGTRRCKHYQPNGACGLPDEFMCVEWLKANGHATPAPTRPAPTREPARDLFGRPIAEKPAPITAPKSVPVAVTAPSRIDVPIVRTLADVDIMSFKALRLEVRLATEVGDVWLVPAYTGMDRQELSVDHAALLATICSTLPGAQVTAFVRSPAQRASGNGRNCEP